MAYTPVNWQTGETISAARLNKMDNGWSVETNSTTLFDGSVTTVEEGGYNSGFISPESSIAADSAIVTFNGTEYECPNIGSGNPEYGAVYGETIDFSTFPFNIFQESVGYVTVTTEYAGTYTLKIETVTQTVEMTNDFNSAVNCVEFSAASATGIASKSLNIIDYEPPRFIFGQAYYRNTQAVSVASGSSAQYTFECYSTNYQYSACSIHIIQENLLDGLIPSFFSEPSGSNSVTVTLFNPTSSTITASARGLTLHAMGFGWNNLVNMMALCTPLTDWRETP